MACSSQGTTAASPFHLSILRDYGLLKGKERKQIVEPVVPDQVTQHLIRLLRAEGIADGELVHHPDWRLWLWDAARAQEALVERS